MRVRWDSLGTVVMQGLSDRVAKVGPCEVPHGKLS